MGLVHSPEKQPEAGDGRTRSRLERETAPRVPLIGVDAGAIPGTKPGCALGAVRELERCAQDLNDSARFAVQRRMKAARKRLKHGPQQV